MQTDRFNLTTRQISIIRSVLAPFAPRISHVSVFGSRALGSSRENSDIDMAIYGDLDEADIASIWTLFDESLLPVHVDVVGYDFIDYPPLRTHIDEAGQILFTRQDLLRPENLPA
jgi:predicted nucleotidyltransferase